jgi:translation elongation factor P/translation initiation factor 5A
MSNSSTFNNSMKFRLWWRRMSISAPRMKIKTQLPWPLRAVGFLVFLAFCVGIIKFGYEEGRLPGLSGGVSREQVDQLREQVEKLTAERDQYSTTANSAETKQNMDKSEQAQLVVQVKTLEGENLKLKEDLAFFESLLPVDNNAFGVSIRRMKAEVAAPNQLHYQLLIMQGGKVDHDFSGDLQLTVTVLQAGKSAMIVFPEQNTAEPDKYKLTFKHYQRAEGVLTLPDGAVAKSVQARVLDKGQIRAQLSMNL